MHQLQASNFDSNDILDGYLEFVDTSVVLFSGTLTIADTADYNGGHGCPLDGIRVCAYNHFGLKEQFACTISDAHGMCCRHHHLFMMILFNN